MSTAKRKKIEAAIRNAHAMGQTYRVPPGEWRKPLANGAKRR